MAAMFTGGHATGWWLSNHVMAKTTITKTSNNLLDVASSVPEPAYAFDGGVGGLGKTKPQTGVALWDDSSPPSQDKNGYISAEIQSSSAGKTNDPKPIRVGFVSPSYPLSPTSGGIEARDVRSTESAYVVVLPTTSNQQRTNPSSFLDDTKAIRQLLLDTVFASQGKYGAYGVPTDVAVKKLPVVSGGDGDQRRRRLSVTFTTLTPAMRESERQVWIDMVPVYDDSTLVCLVVGTTKAKFDQNKRLFETILNSFVAVEAPPSTLRRSTTSTIQ